MFKFFLFIIVSFGFQETTGAEVLRTSSQRVALREFQIDVSKTSIEKIVHCSSAEVSRGLRKGSVGTYHRLSPSYRPLAGEGAWFISPSECPSLAPFTNGIGFTYYNAASGEGMMYLAYFTEKADQDETKLPEFGVTNTVLLPTKCEVTGQSWSDHTATELTCFFKDRKGQVIFDIQNDPPQSY